MGLLTYLKGIPDPRSRHRRQYTLHGLLAILILAAANNENSLRGMWQWAKARANTLLNFPPFELWGNLDFPSYGTFWYLLEKLPAEALEQALRGWGSAEQSMALDGKVLRGSKRAGEGALRVVALVGQQLRHVLAQEVVEEGDELEAALRLLEAEGLQGKVVSADAGLLQASLAQKVVEKGGPISVSSRTTTRR